MNKILKHVREKRGLTQEVVSGLSGVSVRSYQSYEADTTSPNVRTAIAISEVLQDSVEYLFGENAIVEEIEAKPCNSCGGKQHRVRMETFGKKQRYYSVSCEKCNQTVVIEDGTTSYRDCIAAWNEKQ